MTRGCGTKGVVLLEIANWLSTVNMANEQIRARQLFRYRNFHINKSQPLGHGSYGAVYKAKCDQLPCAAKVLHPTILDPNDPGTGRIMQRFQQECAFLESIRHPNIVQYLGMTRDPESRLPVLLMELLDESLTKMLEHSQRSLAYYVQVDICHDIALAITYLHSNDIIHRDLSSNNVLIMAKSRAKVTDFGMSKLAGAAPSMTPLTMCPGTVAYMPPEALREPPMYTKKLDCFSEGVIMIQVCTRLWPEPRPRTKLVPFPASPTGVIEMPILEPERRKTHIDMIDPDHGILLVAVDCLHYKENERPSSEELCQRLAGLKETREYKESVEQVERVQNDIAQLERQMREMQVYVKEATTIQQLRDENQQLQHRHEGEIVRIKRFQRQIQRLNQQLEDQEKVTAEIQQTSNTLQRQVEQLQLQLSQQSKQNTKPKHIQWDQPVEVNNEKSFLPLEDIKWRDGGNAPCGISRGTAVVDGTMAYFMYCDGKTYLYDSFTQKWSELPKCPYWYSSLAVVKGLLTAIGGNNTSVVNILISIDVGKNQILKWVEHFPPMPTKRRISAAVTTKQHLIVAGGERMSIELDAVEVMDTETLVWSTAASLPHPYSYASAAICGDQLYMLGGFDKTELVLTCSLTKLLKSCSKTSNSVWHRIADTPVYWSTCAAVNGGLVA